MNISLEIGFRFLPPDDEIIRIFLVNKIQGNHNNNIREVELLKQEPWELPALSIVQSKYPEWFFYYKLNRISEKKSERTTNAGYWKSTGKDRDISYGGRVIGNKKTLVFHEGRTPRGVKTYWVMHEFRASADYIIPPPNAENNYVVGYLRNNAAENAENSIANDGPHFAPCSSQSDAVGVTHIEVARQLQSSSMDYDIALQAQMEDEGIFEYDLSPTDGWLDLPSPSTITNNDQSRNEEVLSLEDLDLLISNGLVDDEQNEWPQFDDTIQQEMDFMASTFPNEVERSYGEIGYPLRPDYRAACYPGNSSETDRNWANALSDRIVLMSDGAGHGHSGGFHERRMENGVHHDDILIMDSSVDSATVTACEINCLERSVNSKTCKSRYEPLSVKQGHPRRVYLQGRSPEKTETRDKTRQSSIRGAVVELVQNNKSMVQSTKSPKMDGDRNTKWDMNSRSKRSAGGSRKNSFNFVEISKLSSKRNPPLVYLGNVVLGVILFIVIVREVMFLH